MSAEQFRAIWRLALSIIFYPLAIILMVWLWIKGAHWGWGVLVILGILIFDPIYRIAAGTILRWRPFK